MKNFNSKISKEQMEQILNSGYDAATEYAQSLGFESIEAMREEYNNKINSAKSDVVRDSVRQALGKDMENLALLILKQSIGWLTLNSQFDIVDRISDGFVTEGNSKQYIESLTTGSTNYNKSNWIPNAMPPKKVEEQIMHMYQSDGETLADGSYAYKKELTILRPKMIMYFLSGKLDQFITALLEETFNNYKIYAWVKFCTIIKNLRPAKTISGTAANLWEALNNEVLPLMEALPQVNSMFNYDQNSKLLRYSNMDNILFICSNKIASKIRNGIRTQLFNQELFGASGKLLKPENITTLGNELTMTDQNTPIADAGREWIDDNTIIVIDITGIKHWLQLNEVASQFFASNLVDYKALHVWGHMEILKWCRCFKYTNANLSKLPE